MKTFLELKEIDEVVGGLYQKNPKLKEGKFGYAYNKFYTKNLKPLLEEIQEKIADCRVENAIVDEKTKELLYTPEKNYRYDKEGMKKLVAFSRDIVKEYEKKEIEVIPYISKDIPEELLEEEKEVLKGCVI